MRTTFAAFHLLLIAVADRLPGRAKDALNVATPLVQ